MGYTEIVKKSRKRVELREYQNKTAIQNVFGCIMQQPSLFRQHQMTIEDFVEPFHRFLYMSITSILSDIGSVDTPLKISDVEFAVNKEESAAAMYKKHDGATYLQEAISISNVGTFETYYNELRKWSVLRGLIELGQDVSYFYDPDLIMQDDNTQTALAEQTDRWNKATPDSITSYYQGKILELARKYTNNMSEDSIKAGGEGAKQQMEIWEKTRNFGLSYASNFLTTVTYGLRRKRFTVISAAQGFGKSRLTLANMCRSYIPEYYDEKDNQWHVNPHGQENSALYICTEMELREEIEPIIIAYMAKVPEDHILEGRYEPGERERVRYAADALRRYNDDGNENEKCGIFLEYMPEYTIASLEKTIAYHKEQHNVSAVFFDYMHSNVQLSAEYSNLIGKNNYREEQMLLNLSTALKEMSRKYDVSIDTCTQVSGDWKNEKNRDSTIVRGAKSIIDKCDTSMILSKPTDLEWGKIEYILRKGFTSDDNKPTHCLSVYKNRGGRFNSIIIWLKIDYSTMRVHDLFVTDYEYNIIKVKKSRVFVNSKGEVIVIDADTAEEQYKAGNLTEEEYKEVKKIEKQDPSYQGRETHLEKMRRLKAQEATAKTNDEAFANKWQEIVDSQEQEVADIDF